MSHGIYQVVEHDGGWAYKVGDVFSESFAPSTKTSLPVMKLLSSDARKSATAAVSSGPVKGAPGLPKTSPTIVAADGPIKVQPPSQETIASPSDSASVLQKDQTAIPTPVNLVSSEEQPVVLQQQAKPQPVTLSIAAAPSPAPVAPLSVTPVAPYSAEPGVALTTVGPTTAAPAAPPLFPEPKRVKTVSVRPDGSVISSGSGQTPDAGPSAAPAEAEVLPANPPVPVARPSFDAPANGAAPLPATRKLDLPAKPPDRVPIAKIETTVACSQSPETPLQIVPNLLEKVAKAVTGQPATQVAAADPVATSATPTTAHASDWRLSDQARDQRILLSRAVWMQLWP